MIAYYHEIYENEMFDNVYWFNLLNLFINLIQFEIRNTSYFL